MYSCDRIRDLYLLKKKKKKRQGAKKKMESQLKIQMFAPNHSSLLTQAQQLDSTTGIGPEGSSPPIQVQTRWFS